MINTPIKIFLVSLLLILITFADDSDMFREMSPAKFRWVTSIFVLTSYFLAWFAVVRGVKQIKNRRNSFLYNLIAIIGSTLIIIVFTYLIILFIVLAISGFPEGD